MEVRTTLNSEKVIVHELKEEVRIEDYQFVLKPGRSTIKIIYLLLRLMECY